MAFATVCDVKVFSRVSNRSAHTRVEWCFHGASFSDISLVRLVFRALASRIVVLLQCGTRWFLLSVIVSFTLVSSGTIMDRVGVDAPSA